jgi:GNAT superfamily N-acetyltransferase
MALSVRTAGPSDAAVVADFNIRLAAESENLRLDAGSVALGVAALMADPAKGVYFLACEGDAVLGQLAITREWSDWNNGWWWWIQSVYTVTEARGRGVFRTLYQHVIDKALVSGDVVGVRLYVKRHNDRAKNAYRAAGMVDNGYEVFEGVLKS